MNRQILVGDVLDKFKEIKRNSIDVIMTSPPYLDLRDYGVNGQLGHEKSVNEYLAKLEQIMWQCKRVLKKRGTCWINIGDKYNNDKSRNGIPERFYVNCLDNGWISRNPIVWFKPNAMPSSTKDRLTNTWEPVYFFAKSSKYYFNLDPIRMWAKTKSKPFNIRVRENITGLAQKKLGDRAWTASDKEKREYKKDGSKYSNGSNAERLHRFRKGQNKQNNVTMANGKRDPTKEGFNDRGYDSSKGKNPGDVWSIPTTSFPGAHFATFPLELPLRVLKCACPPGGIVLDPFFGSGTVGVAAEKLGLRWMGIEINPKYELMARKELNKYRNQKL